MRDVRRLQAALDLGALSASYTWETLEDAQECRDRRAAMYPDDGPQKIQRRLIWEWEDAPDTVAPTRKDQDG